jgi:restriction system protein
LAPAGRFQGYCVKFKMARNSLFAVLLRSPWWISVVLVLVISLASAALLPAQYVPFGVMGGFPFMVIAVIAAYRQLRAPSAAVVARTLEALGTMSWSDFAQALQSAYQAQGYTVTRLQGDGADLQLSKDGRTTLVCAKRWKAVNQGVEAVRALALARSREDASHALFVSLADLGDNARRFADKNQIEVLGGVALAVLLRDLAPGPKA